MRQRPVSIRILLLGSAIFALGGCGGGGGDDSGGAPITIINPPTPPATPTPSPPATGTTPATAPAIGLAGIGDTLKGPMACGQAGTLFFNVNPRALDRIGSLASIFLVPELSLTYTAVDTYGLAIGGVAAANPPIPSIKRTSRSGVYDYFQQDAGEFELYRNATTSRLNTVTIGRVSDATRICFFGLGGPTAYARPAGLSTKDFTGFADGIAIDATGVNYRLFQSVTTARVDYVAARVELRLDLRGRESAFSGFATQPVAGGSVATGTATLANNGVFEGNVTTADGYSGTVRGQLYGTGASGLTVAFNLRRTGSELAFGAAGLDAN